jgi:voltage-gated potassium channel
MGGLEPAGTKPTAMSDETRLERRLDRVVARATTPRAAAVVIACASVLITVAAGILMTVAEHENFPSIGSGLWWAVQTTTTVGYGDNVPTTVAGRLVATLVMLFGIGFLTVITAAITSTFVARSRLEQKQSDPKPPAVEHFRQLDSRLDRIEASLSGPSREQSSEAGPPTAEQFRRLDERLDRIEAALTRPS